MIKELFTKIQKEDFEFTNEEKSLIEKFINENVIIKNEEHYEINSKYKVGILKLDKNFAILEDLIDPIKNIKVDFNELKGAFSGDLVLVKKIFNPRAKIKAKIEQILIKMKTK